MPLNTAEVMINEEQKGLIIDNMEDLDEHNYQSMA
jgi:hypothetical protein